MRKEIRHMLNNIDKAMKEKVNKEVDRGALLIGADVEYGEPPLKFDSSEFGICYDCKYLRACKTRYGKTLARCWEFDINLNAGDPIEGCTNYSKRNEMDLFTMKEMAILLDVDKKQAGFILVE